MKSLTVPALVAFAFFPAVSSADDFALGDLLVTHPMAFETPKTGKTGGGYLSVTNNGDTADRLIGVRADFPQVMLHRTEEKDGIARMMHVEAIDLPAGDTVTLEPGGMHVMFMGLNGDPFELGEKIPATLIFETAGELDVMFIVEKRNSKPMDHGDHKTTD